MTLGHLLSEDAQKEMSSIKGVVATLNKLMYAFQNIENLIFGVTSNWIKTKGN